MKKRIIVIVVIAFAAFAAWYAFRPERLFVNRKVNEQLTPATAGAGEQALASGSFHSVLHPTQGTASIYRGGDGTHVLRLTNFMTSNGPDVHIYMVSADVPSDNASARRLYPSHHAGQARGPSRRGVAGVFFAITIGGAHLIRLKVGRSKAPNLIPPIPSNSFGMCGGDDGARTRDLCRDRAAF